MKENYSDSATMESVILDQENSPCHGVENISIYVKRKRLKHNKKTKNLNFYHIREQLEYIPMNSKRNKINKISKRRSVPEITKSNEFKKMQIKSSKSETVIKKSQNPFKQNFIVNAVSQCRQSACMNPFDNPIAQVKWRVYRCQLSTQDESCCCSCNSDAMFEVMKSLYDCYKKKNCDHCNCILCGHLPREERKLGEMRKSGAALSTVGVGTQKERAEVSKRQKETKAKTKAAEAAMVGKTTVDKEKILRELVMAGAPLPEGTTTSEKELINKVKTQLGLPSQPKTAEEKEKFKRAELAGIITPLEDKTVIQKEKILKEQIKAGIPLPEGRSASEKALIAKVKAETKKVSSRAVATAVPSEKIRKAKAAGLMTPLQGKSTEQKEKILRELTMAGIPLPVAKTTSEKKLIEKVRADVGMPPEPKSSAAKKKYQQAMTAGVITPLEGKSKDQKEKILKKQAEAGLDLPEGRTASEKAIIAKVKATTKPPSEGAPSKVAITSTSDKLRKAKAAGLLTPLDNKPTQQKEKILKGLAMQGIQIPEGKTASEKKIIEKVRADIGLPSEPKSAADKEKYKKAIETGIITPLEGKSNAQKEKNLKAQFDMGLPLPEGRTASEKAIINKVKAASAPAPAVVKKPSEKLRMAKAAGLLTPITGKSPEQKEKILKGLAKQGLPLPEAKTASEKKIIDKVRAKSGLPPEPKTASMKEKYAAAEAQGIMTPLEGKSAAQKEKILKAQAEAGIPLPEGRTASEKAIISKVKETAKAPTTIPSEKLRKAKAAGLVTPLSGKSPEQREQILKGLAKEGLPLPEGKSPSEKAIIEKVKAETADKRKKSKAVTAGVPALPPEKAKLLDEKTAKVIKEGKGPSDECICGLLTPESQRVSVGKAVAAKIPSEKLKAAKAAGLLTPLAGKSPEQKEKILEGLAKQGLPLPEAKTASEKKIIDKVRAKSGLPPEPKTPSMKEKIAKAQAQGILTPLEGKSAAQKEKILKAQAAAGIPLPEGRTASEKAIISKVKAASVAKIPSEKLRKAREAGLLTPLAGKSPEQKEKILEGLAKQGLPLPEAKTASEKKIIDKVRAKSGLPPEPKTPSMKEKIAKAQAQGILTPLEGKSAAQKEKILQAQAAAGIPLPEGRTASEKAIISKVKATTKAPTAIPSEKIRKAKAAGLVTPLAGKTPEQREKILKSLAKEGLPLPEGKSPSEKAIIEKVKAETADKRKKSKAVTAGVPALPPEKAKLLDEKTAKVIKEGKGPSDECICGLLTPESQRVSVGKAVAAKIPSEKLKAAKAAGLLTPLAGKSPEQKEKILEGLAKQGLPLPEAKTASEKKIIDKVRAKSGLPPEPKTPSMKEKIAKAQAQGILTPLEGKSAAQKEKILKAQAAAGIPLPEGRTASEKAIISKVKAASVAKIPSEKLRKAREAGLLTPLAGKSPEQKEKILEVLAKQGLPLPEAKTASEKKIIDKVRAKSGLPPEPKTPSMKEKMAKAQAQGILTPLEGKSAAQKEKILKARAAAGIPLPEGRTASEKAIISKVKAASVAKIPSEKLRKAREAGLLTPLAGKSPEQKEKILEGLAKQGLPLPEAKTASEKKIIDKVRAKSGLPPEPKTPSMKEKIAKAQAQGILTPLEGKSAAQKEKILQAQAAAGIPLPEGRTASEKAIISKVKVASVAKIPSEKLRKAKEAGLLTPLTGKQPEQKEKILRSLAKEGLPLPEGKSPSEKALIEKVKTEIAARPTKIASEKLREAKAAGPPAPLPEQAKSLDQKTAKVIKEGKGPSDECICGILTPESEKFSVKASKPAKITSEKIKKAKAAGDVTPLEVKGEIRGAPEKIPSEKLRKAKAAGLLTPLEGKTSAQKQKILKGLAEAGIPLPEGKSPSEKAMVQKVKTEYGIPKAVTSSEKEIVRKAKKEGLLTPLAGKKLAEQEKILKGLAEAGLPMPEGKTASTKALIKKIRTAAGLPPEPTPSEKLGKIKTKSKKVGVSASKRIAKRIGAGISKAGIVEEFQDILKTTTCDRGCGCDKKKIRFKHSYVKIRVTSPDISSLCPCPDECVPGVKGGVFTDSEGIKVTVGSAVGFPSFPNLKQSRKRNGTFKILTESSELKASIDESYYWDRIDADENKYKSIYINTNFSNESLSTSVEPSYIYEDHNSNIETISDINATSTSRYLIACSESYTSPNSDCLSFRDPLWNFTCLPSVDSVEIARTESSLSFSTNSSTSIATISIVSFHESRIISSSSHYLCYQKRFTSITSDNLDESEYSTNVIDYSAYTLTSGSEDTTKYSISNAKITKPSKTAEISKNKDTCVFRMRHASSSNAVKSISKENKHKPIIVINDLNSDEDILKMVNEILTKKDIAKTSSIFVVVPTSDEYDTDITDSVSSTICIRISENFFNWKNNLIKKLTTNEQQAPKQSGLGFKIPPKGKRYTEYSPTPSTAQIIKPQDQHLAAETLFERTRDDKDCQVKMMDVVSDQSRCATVDTTQDRPCCCPPNEQPDSYDQSDRSRSKDQCVANVVSELVTPMMVNQSVAQGLSKNVYLNVPGFIQMDHTTALPLNQTTSVSLCSIQGRSNCHDSAPAPNYRMNSRPRGMMDGSCNTPCCPHKNSQQPRNVKGTNSGSMPLRKIEPISKPYHSIRTQTQDALKNVQSTGCGPLACISGPSPIIRPKEYPCSTCGRPTMKDGRKISCLCSGKEKKVTLPDLCACEAHKPPMGYAQTMTTGDYNNAPPRSIRPCLCNELNSKSNKRYKNLICECPEVVEEEEVPEFSDEEPVVVDENENRRIQSDMTQTTSGFKFDIKKRKVLQEEMSFEDAIKYFEEHPEDVADEGCYCDESGRLALPSGDVNCDCPETTDELVEGSSEEALKGLKLQIGAKGSSSKGLSGICCFD